MEDRTTIKRDNAMKTVKTNTYTRTKWKRTQQKQSSYEEPYCLGWLHFDRVLFCFVLFFEILTEYLFSGTNKNPSMQAFRGIKNEIRERPSKSQPEYACVLARAYAKNASESSENEKKVVMAKIGPKAHKFSVEKTVDDGMCVCVGFMPNFVSNTLTPKPKTIVVNDDDIKQ